MLRTLIKCLVVLLSMVLPTLPGRAQVLVYDSFSYTAGERLIGQTNPGTSTLWYDPTTPSQPAGAADTQVIASGSLNYPGLAAAVGNSLTIPNSPQSNIVRMTLPLPSGAGSFNETNTGEDGLFFSFSLNLSNFAGTIGAPATASSLGGFLAGFHSGPFPDGTQNGMQTAASYGVQVRLRNEVQDGLLTGRYQFGLVKNNVSGATTPVDWNTAQSFGVGETVLVVASYQFNGSGEPGSDSGLDDEARLWLNPMPGQAAPEATITSTVGSDITLAGFYTMRSFWMRSDTQFPGNLLVDELRIGQTFADVTPAGSLIDPNGDFDKNGIVDAADFVIWRNDIGTSEAYDAWRSNFGATFPSGLGTSAVPEPASALVILLAAVLLRANYRTRQR